MALCHLFSNLKGGKRSGGTSSTSFHYPSLPPSTHPCLSPSFHPPIPISLSFFTKLLPSIICLFTTSFLPHFTKPHRHLDPALFTNHSSLSLPSPNHSSLYLSFNQTIPLSIPPSLFTIPPLYPLLSFYPSLPLLSPNHPSLYPSLFLPLPPSNLTEPSLSLSLSLFSLPGSCCI